MPRWPQMALLYAIRLPFLVPRVSFLPTQGFHNSGASYSSLDIPLPNRPVDLDSALRALLKDADISLALSRKKTNREKRRGKEEVFAEEDIFSPPSHRELEALGAPLNSRNVPEDELNEENVDTQMPFPSTERKSPAASFGSRGTGAVVLPFELQRSILRLISESDKPLIHVDAERLFHDSHASESEAEKSLSERYTPSSWSMTYIPPAYTEPRSKSKFTHIKARLNRQRDGTAFATVVMPAQYAVVRAVLESVKTRLGDDWACGVKRVLDWGSGTGAGMWAAFHTFRSPYQRLSPNSTTIVSVVNQRSMVEESNVTSRDTGSDCTTSPLSYCESRGDALTQSGSATTLAPSVNPTSTRSSSHDDNDSLFLNSTHITAYVGIEKREGLASISRRLLRDIPLHTSISLQKTFHATDRSPRSSEVSLGTVGLSVFMLSALRTLTMRRDMLKEMWDSGADVLVVIDDASAQGFQNVADARDYFLKLGRREVDVLACKSGRNSSDRHDEAVATVDNLAAPEPDGKLGAHVVAPCPHEHACPLAFHHQLPFSARNTGEIIPSGANVVRCTFVQRLQRPAFVRHTKHVKRGEEDVGYAYVVVRRGERLRSTVESAASQGRVGAVGRWGEEAVKAKEIATAERLKRNKWVIDEGGIEAGVVVEEDEDVSLDKSGVQAVPVDGLEESVITATEPTQGTEEELRGKLLEDVLRNEAYGWPRINFPPLKRNGHVIIDACMPEGKIMRMTFPRSQGKQIYYDARKSKWGDIFPHAPKHRPVLRYGDLKFKVSKPVPAQITEEEDWALSEQTSHRLGESVVLGKRENRVSGARGGESALGKAGLKTEGPAGWAQLMARLKVEQRQRRRAKRQGRAAKEAADMEP